MFQRTIAATLLVGLVASVCSAQYRYGWGGQASTAEESQARGIADIIRSAGSYNLDTSQAAINNQEATRAGIENKDLYQQQWFEARRRNDAYRAEKRGPRPTSEQLFRMNAQRAPNRLSDDQLDPVSGELHWPFLLTSEVYQPYTKVIDQGFRTRAEQGSYKNYDDHKRVVATVDELYEELKKRIRDYDPPEYIEANKFMKALSYDVKFPSS